MSEVTWQERERIRREAMQRVQGVFETIELVRGFHGSTSSGHEDVEKAISYLESWARRQPQGSADIALHMAVALRAYGLGADNAQALYAELGQTWVEKNYGKK